MHAAWNIVWLYIRNHVLLQPTHMQKWTVTQDWELAALTTTDLTYRRVSDEFLCKKMYRDPNSQIWQDRNLTEVSQIRQYKKKMHGLITINEDKETSVSINLRKSQSYEKQDMSILLFSL